MKIGWLSLTLAVGFALPLDAQQPAIRLSLPEMGAFEVMSVEAVEIGQAVTGAPYTAQAVTEVIQQLADGNRIERRSSSTIARDGQGRVRREQPLTAIGPLVANGDARLVTIADPVAGVSYTLNETKRVAMRMPSANVPRTVATVAGTPGAMAGVRVQAGMAVGAGTIAVEPMHRAVVDARTTLQTLPSQQMKNLTVDGTRSTMTIAAGQLGNLLPIEVVTERWFSKELNAVVLSRTSDPRFGETVYRLENIVRGEPGPELFQVPADYQVQELPGFKGGAETPVWSPRR